MVAKGHKNKIFNINIHHTVYANKPRIISGEEGAPHGQTERQAVREVSGGRPCGAICRAHPQRVEWLVRVLLRRLKGYANEERYLALMVRCPGLARDLLHINHSLGNCWKVGIEGPRPPTKATKSLMVALQSFIDGLILISDQDYLDSVGFDFSFVCCP